MTTQTEQSSIPAAQTQGSHHWIITLELPGRLTSSLYGTWTPPAGATRHDVFTAIKNHITSANPDLTGANTMFFALEPNQL
ncbi:hypothetical protein [Streptomyces netropsis]|uniref:Uncharacterized protein n=1 Tax=Streptomyces netropsis TaxID=55404 RepID=A0A7W7LGC7_STRNE|nr:hypothetical protein [Streptomyces netropsis]MBB4889748.1 hypothetical protein [Streptomyces netropsis]GGR40841.1 hypothetical protein GCM10010219_52510 [Streptomyces netropsis]